MSVRETLERLATDTPFYARNCLKIVNKAAEIVPFELNAGQLALDAALEAQREAGKPRRALVLKARQVGFSTYSQGKLIQEATMNANQNALVVAHDTKTGDKLYRMGETMYGQLPDDPAIKPPIRGHRRGRFLHFAPDGKNAWKSGDIWPNSTYFVDTAGEFEAGRGGTYHLAHLSEFAFWERPLEKLTALLQAIPDTPDSLLVIESTANGMNLFRDLWIQAEEGTSDFIPFFWPWWKEEAYTLSFANEREHEAFLGELGLGAFGEDEPDLIKLLKAEGFTEREIHEKLHWRRRTIANKLAGSVEKFHQEYPSTAEEAFVTTGQQVFDQVLVRDVLRLTDKTDPRVPSGEFPGPKRGTFKVGESKPGMDRSGEEMIQVPQSGLWVPREDALVADLWKLWLPGDTPTPDPNTGYVIGVDVSGGESTEDTKGTTKSTGRWTPAYHAVQVIDHKTRKQVAEYRSHVDPNQLAKLIMCAALFFNEAWVAVEITGGWGLPIVRRLYQDYLYPRVYIRRAHEQTTERTSKLLGWHTTVATKPMIEAHAAEMLRDGSHGIQSRDLALEMLSYIKDEKGKTGPESGRFSDLLIAWMIAQQVATEMPIIGKSAGS